MKKYILTKLLKLTVNLVTELQKEQDKSNWKKFLDNIEPQYDNIQDKPNHKKG